MQMHARPLRKVQISCNNHFLRLSRHPRQSKACRRIALIHDTHARKRPILAMCQHGQIKHLRINHHISQKCGRIRKFIPIGNADNPCIVHFPDFRDLLPPAADRHAAVGINIYQRFFLRFGNNIFHNRFIINNRVCIRFAGNRCKAAAQCSTGSRCDILDIFMSGVADVAVHVNQSGHHRMSADINLLRPLNLKVQTDFFNNPILHINIMEHILIMGCPKHSAIFQNCLHLNAPPT